MSLPVILRVIKDSRIIEVKQFADIAQIYLGRGNDCHLKIDDPEVSFSHAMIEKRSDGYYVQDLGSATGTKKQGAAILQMAISSGDEFQIGSYTIVFYMGAPKTKTKAFPPPPTISNSVPLSTRGWGPDNVIANPEVKQQIHAGATESLTPEKKLEIKPEKKPEKKRKLRPIFGDGYAPKADFLEAKEILRPSKGKQVQVALCWRERVLEAKNFSQGQTVKVGSSSDCHFVLPIISKKVSVVKVANGAQIHLSPEMSLEIYSQDGSIQYDTLKKIGRIHKVAGGATIRLEQGEVAKIGFGKAQYFIYIRHVPVPPVVPMTSILDVGTGELVSVVMAFVIVGLLALTISLKTKSLNEVDEEKAKTERIVKFHYSAKPAAEVEKAPEPTMPAPTEPPKKVLVEELKDTPNKPKIVAGVQASEMAPKPIKSPKKELTSSKQGGSKKMSDTENANSSSSSQKDLKRIGLLAAFGGGGVHSDINQASVGAGDLLGRAQKATGKTGMTEDREGEGFGSKLKDTGGGGTGIATEGIAGLGTKGRAGGQSAYGMGEIGTKGKAVVASGGIEEEFLGSIDKEAVRRVVKAGKSELQNCYERELNKNPNLQGKVILEWGIGEQGRVVSGRVKSSTLGDEAAKCMLNRIKAWRFPEPPNNLVGQVTFPFVFSNIK